MKTSLLNAGKYLFILYLIISSDFISDTFGCKVKKIMSSNIFIKHLLGFLTFYFFIAIADADCDFSLDKKLGLSLIVYLVFILSTKTYYKFWIGLILSLGVLYILELIKEKKLENKNLTEEERNKITSNIENLQILSIIVGSGFLITGFIYYLGEKKIEYKDDFNLSKFFFTNDGCRDNILEHNYNTLEVMKMAFK